MSTAPAPAEHSAAGLVILLPRTLELGGITTWAVRTAEALVARDRAAAIVARHGPDATPGSLDPRVGVHRWRHGTGRSEIESMRIACVRAVADLEARHGARCRERDDPPGVVLSPHLSGEAYAAAILAARALPRARVLGWLHEDIAYSLAMVTRFRPTLSGTVCVSEASARALAAWSGRAPEQATGDAEPSGPPATIRVVRTGVPDPSPRGVEPRPARDPVRLIYAGRLERAHKRVMALPGLVERLRELGVACELTAIGDGEGAAAFDEAAAPLGGIRRLGTMDRGALAARMREHDFFVLPSRSEGLGLARIEAAMCGCVPVVAHSAGGAAEGIEHGRNGVLASAGRDADDARVGRAFALAIAAALSPGIGPMRLRARAEAMSMFSMERYGRELGRVLNDALSVPAPAQAWERVSADPQRAARFTVPEDAPARARLVLRGLGGRRVVLYGAGAHTEAILPSVRSAAESSHAELVAVVDDDPARQAERFEDLPIIGLDSLSALGVTDLVISSWLHEEAMHAQCAAQCARAGIRVHRLYDAARPVHRDGCPAATG